jgi:hypothetical protein
LLSDLCGIVVVEAGEMATAAQSSPDVSAYHDALRYSTPQVVLELVETLGRKLTAYLGGVKDTRAVDRWMDGGNIYGDIEPRLRVAFQLVRMLSHHEPKSVVQAWFMGMNPELGDRSPIRLLREEPLEMSGPEVLAAARAFVAYG